MKPRCESSPAPRCGARGRGGIPLWGLFALLTVAGAAAVVAQTGGELRTAEEVRRLTAEQAAQRLPVRLRGVVTFFDERLFSRFLQDDTAGIYLFLSTNTPSFSLSVGQFAEIEGVTSPGEYAPIIVPEHVRVLAMTNLPAAKIVTFEQLASGQEDSQFVEIDGIVRSLHLDEASSFLQIEIATGGGRLTVYVNGLLEEETQNLLGSTVRVRGVCSTQFNRQRQLFHIRLLVPRRVDFLVEKPAAGDPFAIPAQNIGSLLQFTARGTYGHQVKVTGTVICQELGSTLVIQKEKQGLLVQTKQRTLLHPGDQVEVLGFPAQGEYTPILQDAVFRKIGSGPEQEAVSIGLDDALKGAYDCRLVRLEATLLDRAVYSREQFLVLEVDHFIFNAYQEQGAAQISGLQKGSKVSVTGVCLIEPGSSWMAGEAWRAKSFRLLLRSPADVVVLKAPPWWSLEKMLWMIGILGVVVLAAFTWVVVLRRRVQKQTGIIQQKLQTEAALKERYEVLFENANDMVFTLDLGGRITSVNSAGERLLQRRRESLLNQNVLDLVAEDQRAAARQWLGQLARETELPTGEWDFLNATGQRVKLEISIRTIERDGQKVEVEGIARDITERRRLEREILEISNREQRRIGHDLHDGVCQQLAGIAYRLAILGDRLQSKAAAESAEAEQIGNLINEANSQARAVARGLFPVQLGESGLVSALEDLAEGIGSRYEIQCRFSCKSPPSAVDSELALHLYFIAQEALLNAVKHGEATHVAISLVPDGDRFELRVKDDGKGFQMAGISRSGMGIRIMRYRARVIGATLELTSQPGQGTLITCVFSPGSRENLWSVKNGGKSQS
jgi:PAS domain S-box-containing protein